MIELSGPTLSRAPRRLHLSLTLSLLALLLVAGPAQAEEPDEAYLPIFSQLEEAESLESSGQMAQALTNYQQAAATLKAFQRKYPDWNSKVVSARLNRLATKISTLTEKPAPVVQTSTEAPRASQSSNSSASSAEGTAKLLEPGAEPRKALRLRPKTGDKQSVELTLKMNVETKMGAMEIPAVKLPPIQMTLDVNVKTVSPEGDITYSMAVSDATVANDSDGAGPIAEMLKASLSGAKAVKATGTVSDRGVAKAMDVKTTNSADPQSRQAMDQMKGIMSGAVLALPEEAVGVGAKWEVRKVSQREGYPVSETETYELVALEGDRLKVKFTAIQSAANQKKPSPAGGRAGTKMEITKLAGEGAGELTCDLGQLMPLEGSVKQHTEMTMTLSAPQKQTLGQKMDMDIQLKAK